MFFVFLCLKDNIIKYVLKVANLTMFLLFLLYLKSQCVVASRFFSKIDNHTCDLR